jgi:hypothetical protein
MEDKIYMNKTFILPKELEIYRDKIEKSVKPLIRLTGKK